MNRIPGFAMLLIIIVFSGCTKDSDTTPNTTSRDAFIGTWTVSETWTKQSYEVKIYADPNSSNGVFITNFGNAGLDSTPAGAEVNGNSIVLDANQYISVELKINGSGTLSGTKINWNYTLDYGANVIQAVAIYTKV